MTHVKRFITIVLIVSNSCWINRLNRRKKWFNRVCTIWATKVFLFEAQWKIDWARSKHFECFLFWFLWLIWLFLVHRRSTIYWWTNWWITNVDRRLELTSRRTYVDSRPNPSDFLAEFSSDLSTSHLIAISILLVAWSTNKDVRRQIEHPECQCLSLHNTSISNNVSPMSIDWSRKDDIDRDEHLCDNWCRYLDRTNRSKRRHGFVPMVESTRPSPERISTKQSISKDRTSRQNESSTEETRRETPSNRYRQEYLNRDQSSQERCSFGLTELVVAPRIFGDFLLIIEQDQSLMIMKKNVSIGKRQCRRVRIQRISFPRFRIRKKQIDEIEWHTLPFFRQFSLIFRRLISQLSQQIFSSLHRIDLHRNVTDLDRNRQILDLRQLNSNPLTIAHHLAFRLDMTQHSLQTQSKGVSFGRLWVSLGESGWVLGDCGWGWERFGRGWVSFGYLHSFDFLWIWCWFVENFGDARDDFRFELFGHFGFEFIGLGSNVLCVDLMKIVETLWIDLTEMGDGCRVPTL